jgi:hypothetical protein
MFIATINENSHSVPIFSFSFHLYFIEGKRDAHNYIGHLLPRRSFGNPAREWLSPCNATRWIPKARPSLFGFYFWHVRVPRKSGRIRSQSV